MNALRSIEKNRSLEEEKFLERGPLKMEEILLISNLSKIFLTEKIKM